MNEISFSVSAEQMAEIRAYAAKKGYSRPGVMARVAVLQMMLRYPIGAKHDKRPSDPGAVQPTRLAGNGEAVR